MYTCTKFQSVWRTSVFETKFAQKRLQGRVLGQAQPENILQYGWFQVVSGSFWVVSGGSSSFFVLVSMLYHNHSSFNQRNISSDDQVQSQYQKLKHAMDFVFLQPAKHEPALLQSIYTEKMIYLGKLHLEEFTLVIY